MKLDYPTHLISSECQLYLLNANCRKAEIVILTRLKQLQILHFFRSLNRTEYELANILGFKDI